MDNVPNSISGYNFVAFFGTERGNEMKTMLLILMHLTLIALTGGLWLLILVVWLMVKGLHS